MSAGYQKHDKKQTQTDNNNKAKTLPVRVSVLAVATHNVATWPALDAHLYYDPLYRSRQVMPGNAAHPWWHTVPIGRHFCQLMQDFPAQLSRRMSLVT